MRILFVCGKLYASGGENVMRAVVKGVKARGIPQMIALRIPEHYTEYEGVPIVDCAGDYRDRINKLKRIIDEYAIDMVVSFGFPFNLDCSILKLLRKNIKVILCERQDPATVKRSIDKKVAKRLLYPLADGYVVQTNLTKDFYLKHYTKNNSAVCVIPNPVRYDKPEKVQTQRKKKISTVGRYENSQKNHTLLIEAFLEVLKTYPDYQLCLYGDGPDRKMYQELIQGCGIDANVHLMGYSQNPLVDISDSEIFVLPSNHEGMPNALIEAMSIGLPCIATDCGGGGARDLIKNDYNGILIKKNDRDLLARSLIMLIGDKEKQEIIGNNAYGINNTLNLDVIIERWCQFFTLVSRERK